jgi:hypothetical protein
MSGGSEPRRASEYRQPRLAALQVVVRTSSDSAAENLSTAGWDGRILLGAPSGLPPSGNGLLHANPVKHRDTNGVRDSPTHFSFPP